MYKPSSKKVQTFLQSEGQDLQFIFTKVKVLEELNKKVSTYLDIHLAKYCQVANLVNGKLIFVVANGSIATQLRFLTAELLRNFKKDPQLKSIQSIECKVRPPTNSPSRLLTSAAKKMAPLSQNTADSIREIANSLEDPKLREIMLRISTRT